MGFHSNGARHEEGRRNEGQDGQGSRLQRQEAEDCFWLDQGQPLEEQERQDRLQVAFAELQEELRKLGYQEVGRRNEGGPQGLEPQGLRSHGWQDSTGQGPLRQGQVAAQVNKTVSVRSCCPRWA